MPTTTVEVKKKINQLSQNIDDLLPTQHLEVINYILDALNDPNKKLKIPAIEVDLEQLMIDPVPVAPGGGSGSASGSKSKSFACPHCGHNLTVTA